MKRMFLFFFLFFFLLLALYPQTPGPLILPVEIDEVVERLERLEELERDLLEYKELYKVLYENFYKERKDIINKDFEDFEKEITGRFVEFENKNSLSTRVLFISTLTALLGVSLTGILSFIFGTRKRLNEYADNQIKEKLDNIFREKKDKILELIKGQDMEEYLKDHKSILILSDTNDTDRDELQEVLDAYSFKKLDFRSVNTNLKQRKADLILINNLKLSIQKIDTLFDEYKPDVPVIHLIGGKDPMPSDKEPNLYIRANSFHTLYPRMIELLTYQDKMGKSKQGEKNV